MNVPSKLNDTLCEADLAELVIFGGAGGGAGGGEEDDLVAEGFVGGAEGRVVDREGGEAGRSYCWDERGGRGWVMVPRGGH